MQGLTCQRLASTHIPKPETDLASVSFPPSPPPVTVFHVEDPQPGVLPTLTTSAERGAETENGKKAGVPGTCDLAVVIDDVHLASETLAWYQLIEKNNRKEKTQNARRMSFHEALQNLSEGQNRGLLHSICQLERTQDQTGKAGIQDAFLALQSELGNYGKCYDEFIAYKQNLEDGGFAATVCDIRGNLFGGSMKAVFLRSLLQSLVVSGGVVGLQYATVASLREYVKKNPDLIDEGTLRSILNQRLETMASPAWDSDMSTANVSPGSYPGDVSGLTTDLTTGQISALHAGISSMPPDALLNLAMLTEAEIEQAAELMAKPASSYIDETTADTNEIITIEGLVGTARIISASMADSRTEASLRQMDVQTTIGAADGIERSACNHIRSVANKSIRNNLASSAASLLIAGGMQVARGAGVADVGKTALFTTISGTTYAIVDILRESMPCVRQLESKLTRQLCKAGMRVAVRIGTQYLKSAFSSATGSTLPPPELLHRSNLMTSAGAGTLKEVAGALLQSVTDKFLPPDERLDQAMSKTLDAAVRCYNGIQAIPGGVCEDIPGDTARDITSHKSRKVLLDTFSCCFGCIVRTNNSDETSTDMQQLREKYDQAIDLKRREKDNLEEVVVVSQGSVVVPKCPKAPGPDVFLKTTEHITLEIPEPFTLDSAEAGEVVLFFP